MQRTACQQFAKEKGWQIVEEHYEKGVSGYKLSAEERDAIQDIKQSALNGNFDVLLVFMFDRIGRREDETPFVVQFFAKEGIEVWSTQEGEQRFDSHVDKLMNYIRFWQASGESEKTSIRTKIRLGQIVQEGKFRGGVCPYGYELRKTGRKNKRGHEVNDLFIHPYESSIVKLMFQKYALEGMGTHHLAMHLTQEGLLPRKGLSWHPSTVLNILKNVQYQGILRSGENYSEPFEHLRIIDDDLFNKAQKLIQARSVKNSVTRTTPMSTLGQTLLSGNVFCGHCEGRLIPSTGGGKRRKSDGTVVSRKKLRYSCYNKTRKRKRCPGQTTYTAKIVDDLVEHTVRLIFTKIKGTPKDELAETLEQEYLEEITLRLSGAKEELDKENKSHTRLQDEIIKSLTGESKFTQEVLAQLIDNTEEKITFLETQIQSLEREVAQEEQHALASTGKLKEVISWADAFDNCSAEEKKMIVSHLIHRVIVHTGRGNGDYDITIEVSEDIKELL